MNAGVRKDGREGNQEIVRGRRERGLGRQEGKGKERGKGYGNEGERIMEWRRGEVEKRGMGRRGGKRRQGREGREGGMVYTREEFVCVCVWVIRKGCGRWGGRGRCMQVSERLSPGVAVMADR